MHIEYARELLDSNKEQAQKWGRENPELETVQAFVREKAFIKFAKEICSEKAKSILETIEQKADNKYFKVTDKMSYCVAADALEKTTIENIINCFKK